MRSIHSAKTSGIAPGINPPSALGVERPDQVMDSKQVPLRYHPAGLQTIIGNLFDRSYHDDRFGERFKFSTMVLELEDGTTVSTVGMEMTSGETNCVSHNMEQLDWIIEKAGERGQMRPEVLPAR